MVITFTRRASFALAAIALSLPMIASGQPSEPYSLADELLPRFDTDDDQVLIEGEVPSRLWQVVSRADQDGDKRLTRKELDQSRLRIRFGARPGRNPADETAEFSIPRVQDLTRVDEQTRPSRSEARHSAFVLRTQPHEPSGAAYVIISDHTDAKCQAGLQRLADHYQGTVITIDDLAATLTVADSAESIRQQLRTLKVRFVAFAPRLETFRENTLLGAWQLLATLDADPELDAYPGWLVAPDPDSFVALIDRGIKAASTSHSKLRPFAISQVPSVSETRSLQKAGILRRLFDEHGIATPTVAIYSPRAQGAPKLEGDHLWNLKLKQRGQFIREFPEQAQQQLERSSLLIMHGHGIPGMSCSVDIEGIPAEMSGKVVMCGSCFSAVPMDSDLPAMREAPGGYQVTQRPAFALRAVENGANVVFGHMRLSQGFPHLYPTLECLLQGNSVGQSYQELINALIRIRGLDSSHLVVGEVTNPRQIPQSLLLYTMIGDPAARPFQPLLKNGN